MKAAWSAADTTLLRTRPQRSTWYLAVHRPASIFSASIANNFTTFPMSALNLTLTTGDYTQVKKGMTLRVGNAMGGSEKGIIRIRKDMSAEALVEIAESGSGLIDFKTNDVVTAMDQFLPWSIHIRYNNATSAWDNDYNEPHTSQLDQYGPYVNMGPPAAGFKSGANTTIKYHAGDTWFAGDGTESGTVAWVFPDGTTGGTLAAASAPFTLNYANASPSGSYVALTVTDTNGNSAIGRRLTFAFDDRTQPPKVQFGEIAGGIQTGGYKTQIRVSETAPVDDFPDKAEIVIFEEASYGDTASNLGGNYFDRSNIVLRGWIDGKTVTINPFTGDVMFQANTINRLMDRLDSQNMFLIAKTSPTIQGASGWLGASGLTADRSAYHLLQNRSTIGTITDFYSANGLASKPGLMLYQDLARQTLWKQFSKIYREQGNYGYAAADMQSSLFGINDAQITGNSATLPLTEIAKQDRRDSVIIQERDFHDNSDAHFLSIASDIKVWTRSPGDVGAYYGRKKEHSRGMYADQQTLTQWVGNWRALLNSKFPKVKIPLSGNMRLDSVPQSRISMSLSATDNARGYSWSDKEFFPHKTRLVYNSRAGVVLSELEAENVVQGIGGSAMTFPDISQVPTTDNPPETEEPPEIPGDTEGDGMGTVYVMQGTDWGRTSDFSVASPAWKDISGNLSGYSINYFILDPWAPSTTGYVVAGGATSGVYKSTNLDTASPTWSLLISKATIESTITDSGTVAEWGNIVGSITTEGYFIFFFRVFISGNGAERGNFWCGYTENAGSSWNLVKVHDASNTRTAFGRPMGAIDQWSAGGTMRIYCAHSRTTTGCCDMRLSRSDDAGATWTLKASGFPPNPNTIYSIDCPYVGNENGDILYITAPGGDLWKTENGGVDLDYIGWGWDDLSNDAQNMKWGGVSSYTQDANRIMYWEDRGGAPIGSGRLWISTEGGAVDSFSSATESGRTVTDTVKSAGGFPYDNEQFYMFSDAKIYVSVDAGETWIDKTGDYESAVGSLGAPGIIVPNWLE